MPLALVTGATSGIGSAFADRLAHTGHDLILVARTRHHLERQAEVLRHRTAVRVEMLPADLSTTEGCRLVEHRLTTREPVDLLVNNAGIVLNKPFPQNDITAEELVLNVNVRAVLRLTHTVLPGMVGRGEGRVINVASFTALGPGGLATTYPASKSWVLAFTESVGRSAQVRNSGVRVMALLPGFTKTEIFDRSGIDPLNLPRWMWLRADQVVATALRDLDRGRTVSVPSVRYKVAAWGLRHLPRPLLRPFSWDFSSPSRMWTGGAK
ncbi:SDR family NAD(P)-dependent oxidoreductase [Streptomyces mirabilis]|uniref:SDR family NAD(P)-dependent oxidoreductase n=1 Tax=Streptomyces mirabilis TaxID=68239 RepID=UPI0021BED972|nr:SDR family oxidoreductase [Streptomyces mirabilis]MCT9108926.1 SDR family oxidoreductase [Streptomyces mirabilis]